MKVLKSIRTVCVALLVVVMSSCDSWLDLKPIDKVLEDQLYETEEGFKQALTGVYVELNQGTLYGGDLMFRMVEILAQRYNLGSIGSYKEWVAYNYGDDDVKKSIDGLWQKMYSLIMNCNKLLENADLRKEVFTGDNYNIIYGEALALRAMLHFDLLRLFGPVYKTNPEGLSICYNKKFAYQGSNILPASEVIDNVLEDLKQAEQLLVKDPVITEGPRNTAASDGVNDLRLRTYRLNYYAVQALMARVYLYAGRNEDALSMARKLVEIQSKWYPFADYNSLMESGNKSKDRVFSTEVLFGLENKKRGEIFTNYFTPELDNGILAPTNTSLLNIFLTESTSDCRFTPFWIRPDNGKYSFRCFHKYEAPEESDPFFSYLVPMIRISEMFYIVAETTDDETEARTCLNLVRRNRGLVAFEDTEMVDIQQVLKEEYMKEFFGEGQLFFYYKRLNVSSIPAGDDSGMITMDEVKYKFPLPDSETDYRN